MRLILFLAALALTAAAAAQQAPPPAPPQPFATLVFEPAALLIAACDANADAVVTRAELHACLQRSFTALAQGKRDLGYIDYSGWAKLWLGDANALPGPYSVDADDDNRITLAELQAEFDRFFDRYDVDKNGAVTRAELLTIRNAPPPMSGKKKRG